MTDHTQRAGPAQRSVEIGVAIGIAIFALIVIFGSLQAGIGWGAEGPRAGFFPFYVGLVILGSSAINLAIIFTVEASNSRFADWHQLGKVMSIVLPTAAYVILVPLIGIYFASMLLIALFMKWLGNYGWPLVAAVAIGVPLGTFLVFEQWFLVPLPKGPIEELLGF
jgi:hypothetical protein